LANADGKLLRESAAGTGFGSWAVAAVKTARARR
jgi:hypothetical protein